MPKTLTWLHLSDIHFNKKTEMFDDAALDSLIDYLKDLFKEDNSLYPDLIFCTGDIAFGEAGTLKLPEQYNKAIKFFDKLLKVCGDLPKERLFVVPGNHDINRQNLNKDAQNTLYRMAEKPSDYVQEINQRFISRTPEFTQSMERLKEYAEFVNKYLTHQIDSEGRHCYSTTVVVNKVIIGISGFNSAWSCSGSENERNLWLAAKWQFTDAKTKLKDAEIKIGLMHHPIDWLNEADRRVARNRIEQDFHFWLHGHDHDDWVDPGANTVKIAAGAVAAENSDEFGINLVKINLTEANGIVYLHTYSTRDDRWIPKIVSQFAPDGKWSFISPIQVKKNFAPELKTCFKEIDKALKKGKLVFFLGPGINNSKNKNEPPSAIELVEGLGEDLKPNDLIGLPCEACPHKPELRPGGEYLESGSGVVKGSDNNPCPIIKNIEDRNYTKQLWDEQKLLFARLELKCLSQHSLKEPGGNDWSLFQKLTNVLNRDYKCNIVQKSLAELARSIADRRDNTDLSQVVIITTNYDNGLEKAFEDFGLPIDVIYYSSGMTYPPSPSPTPNAINVNPKFFHNDPVMKQETKDEQTSKVSKKPLIPIVVKLFGGVNYKRLVNKNTYVVAESHQIEFFNNAKTLIPKDFETYFYQSNIIFLGYTPNDAELHTLLHFFFDGKTGHFKWLVDLQDNHLAKGWLITQSHLLESAGSNNDDVYWKHWGVDIIPCEYDEFLESLREYLETPEPTT